MNSDAQPQDFTHSNDMTRTEREEMKALSKEVFGSSSKWKSILDHGVTQKATKTVTEDVPQEDGTTKSLTKQVPVLNDHGAEYSVFRRYSFLELKALMLQLKNQVQEMNAAFVQQQLKASQTKAAVEQAKEIHETAAGTAI